MTYRIDEEAMDIVTSFGYPRQLVIQSINRGDVNHATAAYYLLVYWLNITKFKLYKPSIFDLWVDM